MIKITNKIKHWLVKGDCHGKFDWVDNLKSLFPNFAANETAIIILGDVGLNFYLNRTDKKKKEYLQNSGYTFYCLRGNHEQRPELIKNIFIAEDENTCGDVYVDSQYPNIRYLIDGNEYSFGGYWCLAIGGAYSIDKYYRLARLDTLNPDEDACIKAGWFPKEQLDEQERSQILQKRKSNYYDFILSHTCPVSWMPTDLFIGGIDQSTVDKTPENFLEEIKNNTHWCLWLFGHYHADRIERPHVEQYYNNIENLNVIWNRWYGDQTFKNEWWLNKSPNFYYDDNPFYKEI